MAISFDLQVPTEISIRKQTFEFRAHTPRPGCLFVLLPGHHVRNLKADRLQVPRPENTADAVLEIKGRFWGKRLAAFISNDNLSFQANTRILETYNYHRRPLATKLTNKLIYELLKVCLSPMADITNF